MTLVAAMATGKTLFGRQTLGYHVSAFSHLALRLGKSKRSTSFRLFSSSVTSNEQSVTTTTTNSTETTPWNDPRVQDRIQNRRLKKHGRFRQHVNPLARCYQQPTELSDTWPLDVYDTLQNRSLHVDIGCGKGGFLLDYASSSQRDFDDDDRDAYNYLGLEIRPLVAQFAKERIARHKCQGKLDFLGCNANVDLDRLLRRYHHAAAAATTTASSESQQQQQQQPLLLTRVSIQYPDPHFKKQHAKRRVVTADLVDVIAKYMPPTTGGGDGGGTVFLQSDVQPVLDEMRDRFAQASRYFVLHPVLHRQHDYLPDNPLGVCTEREVSVLANDLPVYRVLFQRTATPYPAKETQNEESSSLSDEPKAEKE